MTAAPTAIPDGWRVVRLGDVAEVSFSSVDKRTTDGEVLVELCNYTDVYYNRRIRRDMLFMVATASPAERAKWSLKQGDVLFTKDSETPDDIGVPAYVAEDLPDVLCGYHLGLARPTADSVDGAFLARSLASPAVAREFARVANGVTRFGLTLGATRSLPVLLPPLAEQRAIAAVLDSIDEAIERTDEVISATTRLRDALLHDLLTRGLPGHHTDWREVPGLGTIPADWEVVRLGDVLTSTTYGTNVALHETGDVAVLRMNNIQGGRIDLGDVRRGDLAEEELSALDLAPGDILFNRTNSRELVGKVAVVGELPQPVSFASYLVRLRTIGHLANSFWLGALLGSPFYQTRIRRLATPGVSQANVNPTSLKSISIPLPPLHEQQAVANVLDSADAAIERARMERDALQSMKASTADVLLTGRVRISSAAEPDASKATNARGNHMNRSEVLQMLRAHTEALSKQFGVTRLTLFGSVARDQATDESDIDILAEFASAPGWREYFGAQAYLEGVMGRPVDLMTAGEVRPEIRPYVERDAINV